MASNEPGNDRTLSKDADLAVESSTSQSEKCCPGTHRKKDPWYNQPLPVGVFILLATFLVQQWGWRSQQNFIAEQANQSAAIAQAQGTIEQVTISVGKLLSASAIIVGAHEAKVKKSQLNETIDKYQTLQAEWDQSADLLNRRMSNHFGNAAIEAAWSSILDKLGELDSQVKDLDEFSTDDSSNAHSSQIQLCRQTITDIEGRLAKMTALMTDDVKSSPS